MPLLLIRNDITHMQVDAVVNPANENLMEGSGTSYAIYKAAGEDRLVKACSKIGYCKTGSSVITDGFALCKYIIHTVGPVYDDGVNGEFEILAGAYRSALELAWKNRCKDIAFPLLSAGNYGFPKDVAMKIAVTAIRDFLREHDMMVYLVLYDRESAAYGKKLVPSMEECINDQYVEENNEDLAGDEFYREFLEYELFTRRQLRGSQPFPLSEPTVKNISGSVPDFSEAFELPIIFEEASMSEGLRMYPSAEKASAPATESKKSSSFKKRASKGCIEELMKRKHETFSEMLLRLIDERGMKDSEVYKKANMSKQHFNKIKNKDGYTPKKPAVFSLALALKLSLDETIDLMAKAGHAFSDCSKTDIIVRYYIENEIYDIFEINDVLFHYHLELLGCQ